jgi:hypothetical protein
LPLIPCLHVGPERNQGQNDGHKYQYKKQSPIRHYTHSHNQCC